MGSKFESFLSEHKINHQRLLSASAQIERLRPEDRDIKWQQANARRNEDAKKPEGLAKPRSGRPVSPAGLAKAIAGKHIAGPAKNRILRAVNRLLEQKKQEPVALESLFDAVSTKVVSTAKAASE